MYDFIDTTEQSAGSFSLPAEALRLNGYYIEDQIAGYRTLYVTGREALAPEVNTIETGIRDGAIVTYRRYPTRTITVGYQLIAQSNAAFRAAYNQLAAILHVDEAELVFYDEPDKYFVGTPSGLSEVEPGRNAITAEIEFICADPYKYSLTVREVEPTQSEDGTTLFSVDYRGTVPAYPVLAASFGNEDESEVTLTGNGDCGYVAFMDGDGHVIQLGDQEELDGETVPKSQTLVNQTFNKWDSSVTKSWKTNSGHISMDIHEQKGSLKVVAAENGKVLGVNSYGSGDKWHGPSITRTIPADKAGETGAVNWRASWKQLMAIGTGESALKQRGVCRVNLVNISGSAKKTVAGVAVWKSKDGRTAILRFYVNNKTVRNINIDLSHYNTRFGWENALLAKTAKWTKPVRTSTIQKKGDTVTFDIAGKQYAFTDPDIKEVAVHQMTIWFGRYGTKPALDANYLYSAKFIKDNCSTFKDIPNKFSGGDVLEADCRSGTITLNGTPAPELGALGNDWETFCLTPGTNNIGVAYSDWVTNVPTFTLRYKEVYL